MIEVADVLCAARKRIAKGQLVQKVDALDRRGLRCPATDQRRARSWAITSAIILEAREAEFEVWLGALHAFARAIGIFNLPSPDVVITDSTTHAHVLKQVWDWQDRPGRKKEHVLAAFLRAEEGARDGKQAA